VREGVLEGARFAAVAVVLGIGSVARAAAAEGPSDVPAGEMVTPAAGAAAPSAAGIGGSGAMIGGPSTCPLPDAVWTELGTLVPRDRLNARLRAVGGHSGPVVQIIDLGTPYRVIAAGRVREYRDETHDCAYRARIVAVFVALAIDPAEISMEEPTAPAAPPPAIAVRPRPAAQLDLSVGGDLGIGSENVSAQPGAALRLTVGRDRFAFVIGTMALAPVDTHLAGVRLRRWRLPVDVGGRAQLDGKWIDAYGELGLGAALLSERAPDLASPQGGTSLELGVRAGAGARLVTHGRLAPFVALDVELVPDPPQVFALPQGALGHTPWIWIGATVGASLGFP